jgi:hypothetical protein
MVTSEDVPPTSSDLPMPNDSHSTYQEEEVIVPP